MPRPTGPKHWIFWSKRLKGDRRQFVYVIQAGESSGPIKIGKAKDVPKRLATLQTGNALKLRLLYVIPGGDAMEKALHLKLKHSRLSGEWFAGERIPEFLSWMHDYCDQEKERLWDTGELPRVPDPSEPKPEPKPTRRPGERPIRVASRSNRRNRRARFRTT